MKRTWTILASIVAALSLVAIPTDAARKKPHPAVAGATTLRIHVVDELGRSVHDARVAIHHRGNRRSTIVHTNFAGNVEVRPRPGSLSISVTHHGFVRGGTAASISGGESAVMVIRLLGRHAILLHAHEAHQLGILHRDDHRDRKLHDEIDHLHKSAAPAAHAAAVPPRHPAP